MNILNSLQNWEKITFEEKTDEATKEFFYASYNGFGQNVFVKKIDLSKDDSNEYQLETKALASLNHYNIIPLIYSDVVNVQIDDSTKQFGVIVLPKIGKYNLCDALANKYKWIVNEGNLITFSFNLISAINHIHSRGFVHRDLKPDNIVIEMIDFDEDKKTFSFQPECFNIIDFGSVYSVIDHINDSDEEKLHEKFNFKKTLEYAPPEFINNLEMTEKYDIYSAGIILFMLVTGHIPFFHYELNSENNSLKYLPTENINELFDAKEWEGISEEMQDLIKSMISFNPKLRPSAKNLLKANIFSGQLTSLDISDDDEGFDSYY
ncbi:hypothetical protein M9Y10_034837 [Tritrichomonas musculus]|uniref:Protein kinase domain-containing protein n=1 Tax=Tritrichomonas musculus TaxID=1915356 RepID=A0ABR2KG09_9EUKA